MKRYIKRKEIFLAGEGKLKDGQDSIHIVHMHLMHSDLCDARMSFAIPRFN